MPPQVFSPACLGLIWGTPVLGTHQAVLVVWSGFVHIPPSTPMLWVAPGNSCISTRWSQWGLGSDTVCTCLFSLASVHPALENSGDGIHLVQLVARGPPYFHIVPWCPGELSVVLVVPVCSFMHPAYECEDRAQTMARANSSDPRLPQMAFLPNNGWLVLELRFFHL